MDLFENPINGNNTYVRPPQQNETLIRIPELEAEMEMESVNDGGERSNEGEIDMSILSTDVIEVCPILIISSYYAQFQHTRPPELIMRFLTEGVRWHRR